MINTDILLLINKKNIQNSSNKEIDIPIEEILHDYSVCCLSRNVSLLTREEVLNGRAKFGVYGDGKEVAQIAMIKAMRKGDFRSGYYRDQTILFGLDLMQVEDYFAHLYGDCKNDPFSGGRQMNNHFATPLIKQNGEWLNHTKSYNISSDISPTGGQMPRALGLAFASKIYRDSSHDKESIFSSNGNEVSFCTIGDASTSEGVFWETINAAGVLQVPLVVCIWDDGYGISVPKEYQTTKGSISKALKGFESDSKDKGIDIYEVKGWDYFNLCKSFKKGVERTRKSFSPSVFHINELTQPQGHSTSGSHERYKPKERIQWEKEFDCMKLFREWIISKKIATPEQLVLIEEKAKRTAKVGRDKAWKNYQELPLHFSISLSKIYDSISKSKIQKSSIQKLEKELQTLRIPYLNELAKNGRKLKFELNNLNIPIKRKLENWLTELYNYTDTFYHSNLYNKKSSALDIPIKYPKFSFDSPEIEGFNIINKYFDSILGRDNRIHIFGEDVGKLGGVNKTCFKLQEKYGEERVFDTGIREWTIVGQAIGMAMRGLKPIVEIQYIDYILYAISAISDDLSTLFYRSNGIQKAPVIIRTRGHRLEGIWHAGSPMGMLLSLLRGMHIIVPRNMVQAIGFYNSILSSDDPAIIVECLNGYRKKEKLPDNFEEISLPLGRPEILIPGRDMTIVTYGACISIAEEAVLFLRKFDIEVELIDVQTLLPFDLESLIVESLKKTNRIIFLDEDVPGGATAYMMREVLEKQDGYKYLDSKPVCISAREHRPPFGSDGSYFSKPNAEDIIEKVLEIMHEFSPKKYNLI